MPADPSDIRFYDNIGVLRATFTCAAYDEMVTNAASASPRECGGVLVGFYDDELVTVRHASPPPGGSVATRTSFMRGTGGLVKLLNERWLRGEYYVGEWHAHPDAAPTPSWTDFQSLEEIAREGALRCSSPILAVLGGGLTGRSVSLHVRWSDGVIERLRQETAHLDPGS